MKTLDRYISITFVAGFFLVLSVLVSLFSILELLVQLDEIGKGSYQIPQALIFVLLTVPTRITDLLPVSALLGSIIALGFLADRDELLAMQAMGVSVARIGVSALATVAILSVATAILGEFVAPKLEQRARTLRSRAVSGPGILMTKHGFWARRGDTFVHVGNALHGGLAANLEIYESDGEGRLTMFAHANEALIRDDKAWVLCNVEQKLISDEVITTKRLPTLTLESFLSTEQVALLELPPYSLSAADLRDYIEVLRKRGQDVDRYTLALWQKVTMPLTTCAMVLLSFPFVFGPPRARTTGFRITMAAVVGVTFYLANQIMGHMGILLHLHPSITTLAPVAAVVGIAIWLIRRLP
jgi:lipopolysaccharide export system permease protein